MLSMASATALVAQGSADPVARTKSIAASFSKFKSLDKEKRGVRKAKYVRVESTPAVRSNPTDYSGKYENVDFNFGVEFRVNADGTFSGSGYEPLSDNVKRTFTLRDGRIRGALATATKVYANGATESLEGAFMNRATYGSPTDKGVSVFGFGTLGKPIEMHGLTIDKFFLEKVQ
jgi:hypothetical protein